MRCIFGSPLHVPLPVDLASVPPSVSTPMHDSTEKLLPEYTTKGLLVRNHTSNICRKPKCLQIAQAVISRYEGTLYSIIS